jgi:hypothetical protein
MSHVLVVANQTVTGSDLLESIKARMAEGPCQFTLLVPATARAHRSNTALLGHLGTGLPAQPEMAEDDYANARKRMEFGLSALQGLGATVDGDVGDSNPLRAIEDALGRRKYDEIILSTLPSGISRWLSQDLPRKVTRKFHLPVAVVTAAKSTR